MKAQTMLSKYGKQHTVKRGTVLFSQGDPATHVFYLLEGAVKMYRLNEEGREVIYRVAAPGEFITIKVAYGQKIQESYAETLVPCEILTVKKDVFITILHEDAEFLQEVVAEVVKYWNAMMDKLVGILTKDAVGRVAFVLYRICILFDLFKKKSPVQIPFTFTHEDMAATTGLLRETVTLTMLLLQERDIIAYTRSRITVRNPLLLKRCATFGKKALM